MISLTQKEKMISRLMRNKIRSNTRSKEVCPLLRLLKRWNTQRQAWKVWKSRVGEKKLNTLVIYSVPSFEIYTVGHWDRTRGCHKEKDSLQIQKPKIALN